MGKIAYLIASDLHMSYKNLRNRIDYRNEIQHVCKKLISVAQEYKTQGYEVVLLLLGDVFHKGYNDIFNACNDNNFFYTWALTYGRIYSVLGNHELSYYSANPFYTLISDIKSEKVRHIMNRVWEPVGSNGVLQVVDRLEDGDVIFHFNHYGTEIELPEKNKVNIGLFHQHIVSSEIKRAMEVRYDIDTYGYETDIEASGILMEYQYCFFGHSHTVYGTFRADSGTILSYLASLGRTNINEVSDNFLERNIPVVLVNDGHFETIKEHKFNLLSRTETVKESQVEQTQKCQQLQKERQQIKQKVALTDDSVENVKAMLSENAQAMSIFTEMLGSPMDKYGEELLSNMKHVLSEYMFS